MHIHTHTSLPLFLGCTMQVRVPTSYSCTFSSAVRKSSAPPLKYRTGTARGLGSTPLHARKYVFTVDGKYVSSGEFLDRQIIGSTFA